MNTLCRIFIAFLICIAATSNAETVVLKEEDSVFFHHVMCASDAAANASSLEVAADIYRDDIAKLKKLASDSKALAVVAGEKSNRKEAYVLQFIEIKTQATIEANNRYIQKRGFEVFAKVATSSVFKMCNT